jgi:hypothetical protein
MMRLFCEQSFRHDVYDVLAGETIEVAQTTGDWLLSSYPAYFSVATNDDPVGTSITEAPPETTAVKRAPKIK